MLSTLDWALIDSWKEAQIPLEAVLKGIDRTFEKYQTRRHKPRKVNSLAYCHQEILAAAQEQGRTALPHPSRPEAFPREELAKYFESNAAAVEKAANQFAEQGRPESAATFRAVSASLGELAAAAATDVPLDLEEIERRLTVLEDKMFSTLLGATEESALVAIRGEMDRALVAFRQKMAADQVALLQKQFLQRKLLELAGLPRLSLFYL